MADAPTLRWLQRAAGNQAVQEYVASLARIQRSPLAAGPAPVKAPNPVDLLHLVGEALVDAIGSRAGRTRESAALKHVISYARLHGPKGPLGDDTHFDVRLYVVAFRLAKEILAHPSLDKLPPRLRAVVFAAEKLNLSPLRAGAASAANRAWMTSSGGVVGGRNPAEKGSTGAFGPTAWKCNKLVADSYLATSGGDIGKKKYPFYGSDRTWAYQASDLAATVSKGEPKLTPGKDLKHFPYSELLRLSADGTAIAEIDEFDAKGTRVARYILSGGVFEKHVPDGAGGWKKTKDTRDPADLKPGQLADMGDIVAFHSAVKGVSGHTGLNLGNDLFISAMNATEGVGILSIKLHVDPSAWDRYDYVGFRSFTK
ncbi:MAG: hypothetical protein GEU94_07810 [Micromonosporaceae bacterium]|nr:hypothetical protein [Micromonosporaceae bacterium]